MLPLLLIAGMLQPSAITKTGIELGAGVVYDAPVLIARPFFGGDWDGFRILMQAPLRFEIADLRLRERDYDEVADFGRLLGFAEFGDTLYFGALNDVTLGNGTIVRRFNANVDDDHPRTGARLALDGEKIHLDAFADHLFSRPVVAGRFGLLLGPFDLGGTVAMDLAAPELIDGTMDTAGNLNAEVENRAVYGFDFAWTVSDTPTFRAALTGDFNAIQQGNPGVHAGVRAEFLMAPEAWLTFLIEGIWFGKKYDWAIFDTGYLIDRYFLSWAEIAEYPSGYGGRFGMSIEYADALSIGAEYANDAELTRSDFTAWAVVPHEYIRARAFWRKRKAGLKSDTLGFDRTLAAASGGLNLANLGWIEGTIARVWRTAEDSNGTALYRPFSEVSVTLNLAF